MTDHSTHIQSAYDLDLALAKASRRKSLQHTRKLYEDVTVLDQAADELLRRAGVYEAALDGEPLPRWMERGAE